MKASREDVKILIELAPNVCEANKVIDDNYNFESIREKVAFLRDMFGVQIVGHEKDDPDEITYFDMLTTIINS